MPNEALNEAVKVVMEYWGYKYQWNDRAYSMVWTNGEESLEDEEALVMCKDLNVLDGICEKHGWMLETQPSRANILKRVTEVYECWDYVGTAIIDGVEVKTRKEAALLATAAALKAEGK